MDHLPYPTHPVLPPLRIPYLCEEIARYDGLGFGGFALRQRWLTSNPLKEWHAENAAARAQSWLYFGLLEEVCGQPLDRWDFIDNPLNGQRYVTSRTIPALLKARFRRVYRRYRPRVLGKGNLLPFPRGRSRFGIDLDLLKTLNFVYEQINVIESESPLTSVIALSIRILLWSITGALYDCFPSWDIDLVGQKTKQASQLLRTRMLNGGKCPHWTEICLQRYSSAMIYYLAALPSLSVTIDHSLCTLFQCTAYDVDEQKYVTKHLHDYCDCSMTGPNIRSVTDIIQRDGVPLIAMKTLPTGLLALDVTEAKYGVHYIAISHVWSGGLGNPSANVLPQCQLKRLRQILSAANKKVKLDSVSQFWLGNDSYGKSFQSYEGVCFQSGLQSKDASVITFWIDTLCIPVNLGKKVRQKAINRMNLIYAGADNVLVIDPELRLISSGSSSKLQLRSHLLSSAWMTRCWTYQEARLTPKWTVALNDSIFDLVGQAADEDRFEKNVIGANLIQTAAQHLEAEALNFYNDMLPLASVNFQGNSKATNEVYELISIWNELSRRSTSRRADRLVILAILLDLDTNEIMSLKIEERLRAIFRSQRSLPLSLLFNPPVESRVESTKAHWVPLYPTGIITEHYGYMSRDPSSLRFNFSLLDVGAVGLILDAEDSKHQYFLLDLKSPMQHQAWIQVASVISTRNLLTFQKTCIILFENKSYASNNIEHPQHSGAQLVGARFLVQEISSDGRDFTLVYDCPLIHTKTRPRSLLDDLDEWPEVKSNMMSQAARLSLDCGTSPM